MIRSVSKNSDDYDEKFMKTKFNSDDELPLNKTIKIPSMIIVAGAIFHKNNNSYSQVFILDVRKTKIYSAEQKVSIFYLSLQLHY